jgi:BirA family biotin operon repressor/biotin-[acetyl-CoA-carboxylase] ligase
MSEMAGLSLVVGILTAQALESLNPTLKPFLKWPNDIYVNNQKTGGILIELMAEANGNCTAIISIGLNINMKDRDLKDINQPWTSLEHALNEKLDRNGVVVGLIQSLLSGMTIFHEKGIEPFLPEWKRYDLLENQKISINKGKKILSGIARGINSHGYLLLEDDAGAIEPFSYGDTTLLKK